MRFSNHLHLAVNSISDQCYCSKRRHKKKKKCFEAKVIENIQLDFTWPGLVTAANHQSFTKTTRRWSKRLNVSTFWL